MFPIKKTVRQDCAWIFSCLAICTAKNIVGKKHGGSLCKDVSLLNNNSFKIKNVFEIVIVQLVDLTTCRLWAHWTSKISRKFATLSNTFLVSCAHRTRLQKDLSLGSMITSSAMSMQMQTKPKSRWFSKISATIKHADHCLLRTASSAWHQRFSKITLRTYHGFLG